MRKARRHLICAHCCLAAALALLPAPTQAAAPATAAPATAAPRDPLNPPQGVFEDSWHEVRMGGQKAGYQHVTLRREGDTIFTDTRMLMRIGRLGAVIELRQNAWTEETLDGQPRAFRSSITMAGQPMRVEGRREGGEFAVTMQSGVSRQQMRVALPPGTVMTWGSERETQKRGLAEGTSYTLNVYAPEQNPLAPLPAQVTVGPRENVSIRSAEVSLTRVDTLIGGGGIGGLQATTWVDAAGRALKTTSSLGGLSIEITETTQADALGEFMHSDIFSYMILTLDKPPPADAPVVAFVLRRRDGQPLPEAPTSANQRVETLPSGAVRLTVSNQPDSTTPSAPAPDPKSTLSPNAYLNSDDAEIRRLAAEHGGPATAPPATVAANLRDFVRGYIEKKNFGVGFATASEVARQREGDCTEHAVLLAALGRARGIPTRLVAGLAYMPEFQGKRDVLGYHLWTQFYINGRWVDYDAALPSDGGIRRLGLMASDLGNLSLADFTLGLIGWMGDLEVTTVAAPPAAGE